MPSVSERHLPSDYLVFHLWGPMASWGDIAVGERRGTWSRPSRSAILGLVACALGIERAERARHDELEAGVGFAVRVDDPGRPLRDYHTAQSPSRTRGRRWATRADELAPDNELNTILSERSYLVGARSTIVLWRRPNTPGPTLEAIATHLRTPVFAPYLGRKSCPLGMPLMPHVVSAADPVAALAVFDEAAKRELELISPRWPRSAVRRQDVWLDADDARALERVSNLYAASERTTRRDRVRDRSRWTFADRVEVCLAPPSKGGTS